MIPDGDGFSAADITDGGHQQQAEQLQTAAVPSAGTFNFNVDSDGEDTEPFIDALSLSLQQMSNTNQVEAGCTDQTYGAGTNGNGRDTKGLASRPPGRAAAKTSGRLQKRSIPAKYRRDPTFRSGRWGTYPQFLAKTRCDGCGDAIPRPHQPKNTPSAFGTSRTYDEFHNEGFGLLLLSHPNAKCYESCRSKVTAEPFIQSEITDPRYSEGRVNKYVLKHIAYPCTGCGSTTYWPSIVSKGTRVSDGYQRVPKPSASIGSMVCGESCGAK